jgi:hypothetical protein
MNNSVDQNTISNSTILIILASSSITVIGWLIVSFLTSVRDNISRRKNIKTKYLVEAYRDISIFMTRENNKCITIEVHNNFERAIRDIQIYGSLEEIKLVNEYIMNINKKGYNVDPLLNTLKNNLRKTLKLKRSDAPTHWVMLPELFN